MDSLNNKRNEIHQQPRRDQQEVGRDEINGNIYMGHDSSSDGNSESYGGTTQTLVPFQYVYINVPLTTENAQINEEYTPIMDLMYWPLSEIYQPNNEGELTTTDFINDGTTTDSCADDTVNNTTSASNDCKMEVKYLFTSGSEEFHTSGKSNDCKVEVKNLFTSESEEFDISGKSNECKVEVKNLFTSESEEFDTSGKSNEFKMEVENLFTSQSQEFDISGKSNECKVEVENLFTSESQEFDISGKSNECKVEVENLFTSENQEFDISGQSNECKVEVENLFTSESQEFDISGQSNECKVEVEHLFTSESQEFDISGQSNECKVEVEHLFTSESQEFDISGQSNECKVEVENLFTSESQEFDISGQSNECKVEVENLFTSESQEFDISGKSNECKVEVENLFTSESQEFDISGQSNECKVEVEHLFTSESQEFDISGQSNECKVEVENLFTSESQEFDISGQSNECKVEVENLFTSESQEFDISGKSNECKVEVENLFTSESQEFDIRGKSNECKTEVKNLFKRESEGFDISGKSNEFKMEVKNLFTSGNEEFDTSGNDYKMEVINLITSDSEDDCIIMEESNTNERKDTNLEIDVVNVSPSNKKNLQSTNYMKQLLKTYFDRIKTNNKSGKSNDSKMEVINLITSDSKDNCIIMEESNTNERKDTNWEIDVVNVSPSNKKNLQSTNYMKQLLKTYFDRIKIKNKPCTKKTTNTAKTNNKRMLMDQKPDVVGAGTSGTSKPVHIQRVISATNLDILKQPPDSSRDLDSDISDEDDEVVVDDESIEAEREQSDDGQNEPDFRDLFNFDNCDQERSWVPSVFQENTHEAPHLNYNYLIQQQSERKKVVVTKERCMRSMYYSVGLLSSFDKYPEVKKIRGKPPKKKIPKEDLAKSPHYSTFSDVLDEGSNDGGVDLHYDGEGQNQDEDSSINSDLRSNLIQAGPSGVHKKKARKFKDEESRKKWEDVMTLKRKKVFTSIVKKEVSKQHRAKINKHKEMLIQCKRVALQCQKVVRQKALHSARVVKEQQWRMKRLARENLAYWKRSKRVDREIRRKLEKEAEEQRKMDFEFIEAKRQQRKLNFLITQTELYAHFMSKKLGTGSPEEQLRILNQLDEEKNPRLANIDDYDSDLMKAKAMRNAEEAFQSERARTMNFDMEAHSKISAKKSESIKGEHPQPAVFRGNLKGYQLKGMNWLANLYDQGISGILADEMGLGKTVQSIAFLCHIAERYSVWGPFLIISPASTLHNWQQEIAKFVPDFKVVPYWGNPNERKILRQFWDQKDMHTKDASFHIVVTSYQIVITDIKYFNRIKWQYMILDEAQAIKSTSSMRWKTLLGFSCRNRLLLSGTPIQNSMAELWALLHFIMPTLFDSHEEFNEWFSKDIESHAENKTGIDEKHLSRLHMILKPFMLRRIKKDVENELSDKIEVMVYCPLTTRQKLLYMALKQKIRIEDLLHYTVGGGDSHTVDKNFTSNLMNLVMQFRKVCNHPELFERRDAKSPIYIRPIAYEIPYLVYNSNVREEKFKIIQKYFSFSPEYIAHALRDDFKDTIFSFAFALKLSTEDLVKIFVGNILHRWKNYYEIENDDYNSYYQSFWSENNDGVNFGHLRSIFKMSQAFVNMSKILKDLAFTWDNCGQHMIYTHTTHAYYSMPETVEHKNIRAKTVNIEDCEQIIDVVNDDPAMKSVKDLPYEERPPQIFECERTVLPSFLFSAMPKLETTCPILYCYSRKAAWDWKKFIDDYSWHSLQHHWSHATDNVQPSHHYNYLTRIPCGPVDTIRPAHGWSHIAIPDKETLVTDSGKLSVLDGLLKRLKEEGHRILIYSQMTKMIDLLEEYMWHRHHKYMRLDGSSKISERRDMVADFQARTDIFVFLLSTRAGGLGINLTAADTVIFYDSDWNPTVDQQAMDRAHRLGQTKQVTVYRLICKGSIEERILQRAREKSEIQKLVISGGNFKPDTLKPKEVVSLLLDDEEIEQKYRQRTEERKQVEDMREMERKRKHMVAFKTVHMAPTEVKKLKQEGSESGMEDQWLNIDSAPSSPHSDNSPVLTASEDVNDGNFLDVEGDTSINSKYTVYNLYGGTVKPRIPGRGSSKRGRPRGSRRVSALGRFNSNASTSSSSIQPSQDPVELGPEMNVASSTSGLSSFDLPGTSSTSPSYPSQGSTSSSGYAGSPTVRRGPGRPRLKPGGPPHSGSRGPYRPRKPARPLPVPLPTDGGGNATGSNSGYSSYLYDYPEQPSDS